MIQIRNGFRKTTHERGEVAFQRLKSQLHEELVESLDLASVQEPDSPEVRRQLQRFAKRLIERRVDSKLRPRMLSEMHDELFGLGPLESLMQDRTISDILINGPHEVFIEREGQLRRSDVVFADRQHLTRIVQRVVSRVGRRIDEVSPMVDARLPDGSRVNAVVPPLAIHGPLISIRKFVDCHLQLDALVEGGSISPFMAEFLQASVAARVSCLISGGAGAGKTTLLNAISAAIPRDERLVTIEDSAELQLQHPHVAQLETRPSNSEGAGEVTQRELVKNSLRMRPDRILIGEVRGAEALDMLQAMNTGHEGSLTTIHANDTRDALSRLEMMVAMTGFELPIAVVRQYIASGLQLVVHLARLKGGVRKVIKVTELMRAVGGDYETQDLFVFRHEGVDDAGIVYGAFAATGNVPTFIDRFQDTGVAWNPEWFSIR